jgi:flagellar protein FlaI
MTDSNRSDDELGDERSETVDPANHFGASDEASGEMSDGDGSTDGSSGEPRDDGAVDEPEVEAPTEELETALTLREDEEIDREPSLEDDPDAAVREEILDDVLDFFEGAASEETEWIEGRPPIVTPDEELPTEEFVREQWFDFDYLDEYELVDWKWVNRPYSYISVLYDTESKTYRYHVSEPVLEEFEQYVRSDLTRVIRNNLMYEDVEEGTARDAVFANQVAETMAEHAATVGAGTVQKLYYYFMRDFLDFGRIDALMRDGAIEDISCDGVGVPVFVYHRRYRDLRTNVVFEAQKLNSLAVRLAQRAGKHISVSNPLVDASLADGSRIQLTLGTDISRRGTNFTIRKFTDVPYTPIDLIKWNTFDVDQMAYFWLAIENNRSLVFAGGTGSGKTTSLNAVSFFIPPDSKVVSIEDTREITLPHENWVQSVTRQSTTATGQGAITTHDLLQAALRQRPEYLLVGEIRTEQRVALTFFQAIGTGHTAYTTIHADSMESVLARLQNPPLSVPSQMVRNLDIVSIQRQVIEGKNRVRRNAEVCEIEHDEAGDVISFNRIFRRDASRDTYEQVGDSTVLDDIADMRGWTDEDLERELEARREVLTYLVENDINDYDTVASTIHAFARDPDSVLDLIRDDDLEPELRTELS